MKVLIIELNRHLIQFQVQMNQFDMLEHVIPFPRFTTRFKSRKILVNHVKECLIDYYSVIYHTSSSIFNYRLVELFVANDPYDILIYVKDVLAFSSLSNQIDWPRLEEIFLSFISTFDTENE